MRVEIKDVHYGNYSINKIYYGSNLVFDRSAIYDLNQNVYIFDLSKVTENLTLTLQNVNSGTTTDWGDGTIDANLTHTYASQGIYTVKTRQRVNNSSGQGDSNTRNSLINCENIDDTITTCAYMFENCVNLASVTTINDGAIICAGMFHNCTNLTTAPTIPSSVTTCAYMFQGCTNLITTPIIPNTVINCYSLFYGCTSLTTIPQANIDLMEAVKVGTNTTCTSHSKCYYSCINITNPQTYATLSGLYPNWFTS